MVVTELKHALDNLYFSLSVHRSEQGVAGKLFFRLTRTVFEISRLIKRVSKHNAAVWFVFFERRKGTIMGRWKAGRALMGGDKRSSCQPFDEFFF